MLCQITIERTEIFIKSDIHYVSFELKPKGEAKIEFSSDPCISVQVERDKIPDKYTQ